MQVSYVLSPGTQIRFEKGGLLFYQARGPRRYFLSSGSWLSPDFFYSGFALKQWLERMGCPQEVFESIEKTLAALEAKGVLHACKSSARGAHSTC
jgi:hypothetical protein